jgi:DNA-binding PadR family transcriptional regulator
MVTESMPDRTPPLLNLWSLTVLCLLREVPMHPYEMQRLIRQRKKDDFLDLKRGSLYHNIERLQRAGLIEAVATTREGRRPQRTVYRLTEEGERELLAWLRELLAKSARDSVPFVAALSFLGHLRPEDALEQLSCRSGLLRAEIERLDAALKELTPRLGRLLVLEAEYERATCQAELDWVQTLIDDLRNGRLTWKPEAFFPRPGPA